MNNSGTGSNMIMTNSSMSTMAGMAGGGLVVSSSVNKALTNTTNMMPSGHPHHPTNHTVMQVCLISFIYNNHFHNKRFCFISFYPQITCYLIIITDK